MSKGAQIIVLQIENITRISTAAAMSLLCCCSALDAAMIETLPDFDSVANVSGAVNIIFDNYVPDINGATNGVNLNNPGQYMGFYNGDNGQASVGLLVGGSKNQVVFADYYSSLTTSDIAGGDFQNGTYPDSGTTVTFTFVDPSDSQVKLEVSRVAFELKAVGQGDNVSATFLDINGAIIHTTGILSDGRFGYVSRDTGGGTEVAVIHQLVLTSGGTPPQLWTIGYVGDTTTTDFAYAGPPLISITESDDSTRVNEQGPSSDTYILALGGAGPSQNVTVSLNYPTDPCQVSIFIDGVETNTMTFTLGDWNTPQTVTVTAIDDNFSEATHYLTISHNSSSDDFLYHNIDIDEVLVQITDNDGNLIKVFLVGGQSNAAGSGLNSEYPALYQTPQYDIEFWNGGRLPGDGVPDYTAWDRAGDTAFRPLEFGSGNYLGGTHSGPEISLGRTLKDVLPDQNIAIVKYGMSGSALKRGLRPDGAGDWDSDPAPLGSSFDGVRYHVFKNSAILPALQAITDRGDCYEIAGMFWMQGETDAGNLTAANEYEANLNKLINSVRTEFSAPQMRFVIGRIRTVMGAYNATVRTAIENVAAADPLVEWVNTDDLNMNGDNVHYSAIGQVGLGERFAHAYLSTVPSRMRGDLQLDDDVDLGDFAIFANRWMDICSGSCGEGYLDWADINEDCRVGFDDLRILADFWLTDLLMHCTFDEASGSSAHDSSAFSQTWLLRNFPDDDSQWVAGKIDGALQFDGSDDYVDLRSSFDVLNGATEFTISLWINPAQLPFADDYKGILCLGSSGQRCPWIFGRMNGNNLYVQFETMAGGAADCSFQTSDVGANQWTHLVVTWDGSTCSAYLNGVFDNSDDTVGDTLVSSDGINYIGYKDGYDYWNGLLDDIRIYNRELGLEEIQLLANQ